MDIPEFIRAAKVVDHWFLCKRDVVKRAKRYRRYSNQRKYMGKRYVNNDTGEPMAKKQKKKKSSTQQRIIAVGGQGTKYREKKNIDTTPTFTLTASAGGNIAWATPVLLNGVAVGDDGVSRDGRKVLVKSILSKIQFMGPTSGGAMVRVVIFYDKQANGAVPAVTDIFQEDHFLTNNNLGTVDRFVILKDFTSKDLSGDGQSGQAIQFSLKSVKGQMETIYSGTTSAVTSISSGAIYMAMSGWAYQTGATPVVTVRTRVRFVDV